MASNNEIDYLEDDIQREIEIKTSARDLIETHKALYDIILNDVRKEFGIRVDNKMIIFEQTLQSIVDNMSSLENKIETLNIKICQAHDKRLIDNYKPVVNKPSGPTTPNYLDIEYLNSFIDERCVRHGDISCAEFHNAFINYCSSVKNYKRKGFKNGLSDIMLNNLNFNRSNTGNKPRYLCLSLK